MNKNNFLRTKSSNNSFLLDGPIYVVLSDTILIKKTTSFFDDTNCIDIREYLPFNRLTNGEGSNKNNRLVPTIRGLSLSYSQANKLALILSFIVNGTHGESKFQTAIYTGSTENYNTSQDHYPESGSIFQFDVNLDAGIGGGTFRKVIKLSL